MEFEGCFHLVYELEKKIVYLNDMLADTEIQWQRKNIIGIIERIEKKKNSFFGFYDPLGTPSSSSSDVSYFSSNNSSADDAGTIDRMVKKYVPPGTPSSSSSDDAFFE